MAQLLHLYKAKLLKEV